VNWITTLPPLCSQLKITQCRDPWQEDVDATLSRTCGECGRDMTLAVALPRLGALPALRSYRCTICGNVELDVLEHFGPRPRSTTVRQPRP
jgi:hypothetical protein